MRALGYVRLSETSNTSIANQKSNIRDYAAENGFDLEEILDDGQRSSGFKPTELERWNELKRRVVDDAVEAVIVNAKRRIARDENEVMRFIADLRTNGVELHTHHDGQVSLEDPMNAAIEILRASSAAEEKRKEISLAKEALEKKKQRGDDLGRPRFGMTYSDDKRRQVPGEDFDTVERILELSDRGLTYAEIAEDTGESTSTIGRVVNRRDWYRERAEAAET